MAGLTGLAVTRDGSSNGTTPKGFRLALAGMLAKNSQVATDVRQGVLWDGGASVVTGAANMSYNIRACMVVVLPTASQGPIVVPNDATLNIVTTAAPGSNSRIDVIWVRQHLVAADGGADSNVTGEFGVTQGTVAASPVAPTIPTGAVEIARTTVTTGTTATNTLTISQTHLWTAMTGAPVPVRSNSERTAVQYANSQVYNLTSGFIERYDGSSWTRLGGDTGWQSITPVAGYTTTGQVRKIGTLVVMRGYIIRTSSFSASLTSAANLPAGFNPSAEHYFSLGQPVVSIGTRGYISTGGNIQIAMEAANAGGMALATSWYTD